MDPIENDIHGVPATSSRTSMILALVIIGAQVLVALMVYPFLPDLIPSHWNLAGQVDSYGPKLLQLFLWPVLSFVLFFLIRFLIQIGPRLGRVNQRVNVALIERMLLGLALFMLAMQLITIATALHMPINNPFLVNLLLGLVFIFIGNYMGKLQRNFWAGIRTPWTLVSDVSWERTHRVGGWLFVAAGVLMVVMSFVPALRVIGFFVMSVMLCGLVVYSYLVYRKEVQRGKDPLTPPFDSNG